MTGRATQIAIDHVPVVTSFTGSYNSISTASVRARVRTLVSVAGVAVVTLFTGILDTISTPVSYTHLTLPTIYSV